MIILLHISIALGSAAYLAVLLFRPTRMRFAPAYISAAATLGTVVLLMIIQPSAISHVCVSGSVYLMTAIAAISFASYRRAKLASLQS